MKKLVLIGAGGFGREVANMVEVLNERSKQYELLGFLDDGKSFSPDVKINNYPWLGTHEWAISHKDEDIVYTCAIGNPEMRSTIQNKLTKNGIEFETLIAAGINIPRTSYIGKGCILGRGSSVSVNCYLADGVILNSGVIIGHDTRIEEYTTILTSSGVSGCCHIGEKVIIGGHAFIVQGRTIGNKATVAAGSIVFTNVKAGATVLGNPAKRMREIE